MARHSRVRGKAREALDAIIAAGPKFAKAYLLKESFVRLWDFPYKGCAREYFRLWKSLYTEGV
jgi:hypothetical protein